MANTPIWAQENKSTTRFGFVVAGVVCLVLFAAMFKLEFFNEYLAALYVHYGGLMSGIVSLVIGVYERYRRLSRCTCFMRLQ